MLNTQPLSDSPPPSGNPNRQRRQPDPILQELYDIRAKLNAEAGYSVERLLEIVRRDTQKYLAKPID